MTEWRTVKARSQPFPREQFGGTMTRERRCLSATGSSIGRRKKSCSRLKGLRFQAAIKGSTR